MVSDLCLHVTKPLSKELITFPFSEFSNGYEQVRDLLEFPTFEQTCARWGLSFRASQRYQLIRVNFAKILADGLI